MDFMDSYLGAHAVPEQRHPPWHRAGLMLLHMLSTSATISFYYKALLLVCKSLPEKTRKPMAMMDSLNMIWLVPWKGLHVGYWGLAHLTYFFCLTLLSRSTPEVLMVFCAGVVWELVENVAGRLIGRQTKGDNKHGRYHEGDEEVQYLSWWAGTYVDVVMNSIGIISALLIQFFLPTHLVMYASCAGLIGYQTFICYRIMKVQMKYFSFSNMYQVCVTLCFWTNHSVMGLFLPAEYYWINYAGFALTTVTQAMRHGPNVFYVVLLALRLVLDYVLFYLFF